VFVQVIEGRVRHTEPVYVELDVWIKELSRSAQGWLGSTAGVTDDMRFIALSRWDSAESARQHSARPEQDHWWRAFRELFVDAPAFRETSDIFVDTPGDPDQARFVQVMRGAATDPGRARDLMGAHRGQLATFRPEVLGTLACAHGDGTLTVAAYFTTEDAAREGERKQPPPELKADMDELNSLAIGPLEFFDLREPWLHSPAWSS
jgi:hypothetical protein